MRRGLSPAMRTSEMTGLGAGPERVIKNGLDRARASSALGTAAEAVINLLGVTRKAFRDIDGVANVVVAQEVTGTDDHGNEDAPSGLMSNRYGGALRDAKEKI